MGRTVFTAGRVLFAIAAAAFGVLHFVGHASAPGQFPWSYLTGIAFLAAGAAVFLNNKVRLAASLLGVLILLFGLLVWVPWVMKHHQDAAGGNCLKDLGLAGGAMLLAGALPRKDG